MITRDTGMHFHPAAKIKLTYIYKPYYVRFNHIMLAPAEYSAGTTHILLTTSITYCCGLRSGSSFSRSVHSPVFPVVRVVVTALTTNRSRHPIRVLHAMPCMHARSPKSFAGAHMYVGFLHCMWVFQLLILLSVCWCLYLYKLLFETAS